MKAYGKHLVEKGTITFWLQGKTLLCLKPKLKEQRHYLLYLKEMDISQPTAHRMTQLALRCEDPANLKGKTITQACSEFNISLGKKPKVKKEPVKPVIPEPANLAKETAQFGANLDAWAKHPQDLTEEDVYELTNVRAYVNHLLEDESSEDPVHIAIKTLTARLTKLSALVTPKQVISLTDALQELSVVINTFLNFKTISPAKKEEEEMSDDEFLAEIKAMV